jgi:hypothetical protein
MKAYGEWMYMYIHVFLTSAWLEVSGELHAPAALRSGERTPVTHWDRRLADRRTSLDDMDSNSDPSIVQPIRQSLYRLRYRGSLNNIKIGLN